MKKIILILVLFLSASWAQNLEINPDTGLIIDPFTFSGSKLFSLSWIQSHY